MPKKATVHTMPDSNGGWKNSVNGKTSSTHDTKAEALKAGRNKAEKLETEHVIHGKDGKIQNSNSYGNDPNPPKDTR